MSEAGRLIEALAIMARMLLLLAIAGLILGFVYFIYHIETTDPPADPQRMDGIVVLTGKGGGRLQAGADLLRERKGERLLISGINPAISREKMQSLLQLPDPLYNCCVDLDYQAENTFDNGQETANWTKALGYERIILVTSSYHMPRAKLEISGAIGQIEILPYPVHVRRAPGTPWWGGSENTRRWLREYGKLLFAYAREPGARPAVQKGKAAVRKGAAAIQDIADKR